MACFEMYNSDQHKGDQHHHMSPRISFSNDFVDVQQAMKLQQEQRAASSSRSDSLAVSSDFEFSGMSNYSMMSADELFFKGRLLSSTYKDDNNNNHNNNNSNKRATTTLKEELLINDDHDFSLRPPKPSSTRWKGLLGLRKTHIGSKKTHKTTTEASSLVNEEVLNEGGSSCRDLEIGI